MQYFEESTNAIQELKDKYAVPSYFIREFDAFKKEVCSEKSRKVGFVGEGGCESIYALYAESFGLNPIVLQGGSYSAGEYAGDIFPQISDPVAKSAVGLLLDEELDLKNKLDAVIMIASNDSYKKAISYLRDEGYNVIAFESPAYIAEELPNSFFMKNISLLNDLSKISFKPFNQKLFFTRLKDYTKAYYLIQGEAFKAQPMSLQSFLLYVLNIVKDKAQWCSEVEKYLVSAAENGAFKAHELEASIILMGSPIQFPNNKMYEILNDSGVPHYQNDCLELPSFNEIDLKGNSIKVLRSCLKLQYKQMYKAQAVGNTDAIRFPEGTGGIIYYLLKGETSESYEAERMEEAAIKQNIPFLCIETDYTDTDKEQIKIRVEAFYEMLSGSLSKAG